MLLTRSYADTGTVDCWSAISVGSEEEAAIHLEDLLAHPASIVGCKECDGVGNVGGLSVPAERRHIGDALLRLVAVPQPAVHVGRRDAWRYGVHCDPAPTLREGERARHDVERALRHRVDDLGDGEPRHAGRNVDDAASIWHEPERTLSDEQRRADVDVEDTFEVFDRRVLYRRLVADDRRVVHQDVERASAEAALEPGEERVDVSR